MSYSYLLFDADDTLFDFQIAQEKSLNEVFEKIGLPLSAKDTYKEISHGLWQQLEKQEITLSDLKKLRFNLLLKHYPTKFEEDVETLYEHHLSSHADLIDGAKELLEALSKKYHLVIISNGMPNIQHPRLKQADIEKYFEAIFISDEIGAQKPSKEFFDIVFKNIPISKEKCLVIGDSLSSDIAGGCQYGIDTCYLHFEKEPSSKATYNVKDYEDIKKLLL